MHWQPRETAPDTDDDIIGYSPTPGDLDEDELPSCFGITTGRFLRSGGWEACTHWAPLHSPGPAQGGGDAE